MPMGQSLAEGDLLRSPGNTEGSRSTRCLFFKPLANIAMSAASRAEARRQAILSRGSDRLAKLTTSARGENAPAYMHDDPPLPNLSTGLDTFVGEGSAMPFTRPSPTPTPLPTRVVSAPATTSLKSNDTPGVAPPMGQRFETTPDQRAFMQALMSGATLPQQTPESLPGFSPIGGGEVDPTLPPMDNPFAAMLFPKHQTQGMGNGPGTGVTPDVAPSTKLQRLMPFIHLGLMWCLLAYSVLWQEPKVYRERHPGEEFGNWGRWAQLGKNGPLGMSALRIEVVPFFWAFTTLQILLHSLRIFSGFDAVQPPTLIALALPHLPPTASSVIVNALKYVQMGSLFLDDLSGLVVGLGFIVVFSGWFAVTSPALS